MEKQLYYLQIELFERTLYRVTKSYRLKEYNTINVTKTNLFKGNTRESGKGISDPVLQTVVILIK